MIELTYPLIGDHPITQLFGAHSQPSSDPDDQALYLYYRSLGLPGHNGVDIAAPAGTPVYAAADGTVIKAGWDSTGFGNRITLQHKQGRKTLYGHLQMATVQANHIVTRGQMIGRVGSTGYSSGPHLHFGLYIDGAAVDPLLHLAAEAGATSAAVDIPAFPALPRLRVTAAMLRVRQGPGVSYQHVDTLAQGVEIPVIGVVRDADDLWANIGYGQWCAVRYDNETNAEWA